MGYIFIQEIVEGSSTSQTIEGGGECLLQSPIQKGSWSLLALATGSDCSDSAKNTDFFSHGGTRDTQAERKKRDVTAMRNPMENHSSRVDMNNRVLLLKKE